MPRKPKLPKHVRKFRDKFRAVFSLDGERIRSPVLATVEEVVQWMRQFHLALEGRGSGRALDLTLAEGLDLIRQDLAATEARAATIQFYEAHARILFAGIGGPDRKLDSITAHDVRRYIDDRRAAGVSPQVIVGKELFVLRRIRKLAMHAGFMLPVDPFLGVRLPKGRAGRFDVLTQARVGEIVKLMRETGRGKADWHADLVELMFGTGLRKSEVGRLRVQDIDLPARRLSVDGKTGLRYQPFGQHLAPVLQRLIAQAQPDGRIITTIRVLEKLFERWAKRAQEPRFSAHVLRHSYATAMAARVKSPFELMALMGHQDLKQTSRYYHGRDESVLGALDGLSLRQPADEPSRSDDAPAPSSDPPARPRGRRGGRGSSGG